VVREDPIDEGFVRQVTFVECVDGCRTIRCTFVDFLKSLFFRGYVVVVVHVAQTDDVDRGLGSEEFENEVTADEAGRAGDEYCFIV